MNEETYQASRSYWPLEKNISNGFNRLKGKIFNLVEATNLDEKQQKAIKGLIKSFANEEFRAAIQGMRYDARNAGFLSENEDGSIPPISAEPLETE